MYGSIEHTVAAKQGPLIFRERGWSRINSPHVKTGRLGGEIATA